MAPVQIEKNPRVIHENKSMINKQTNNAKKKHEQKKKNCQYFSYTHCPLTLTHTHTHTETKTKCLPFHSCIIPHSYT